MSQPMPTMAENSEAVAPHCLETISRMIDERTKKGIKTYGTPLMTFNGRDSGQDALEELVDAFQYVTQMKLENEYLKSRVIALNGNYPTPLSLVLLDIIAERRRQDNKWGEQNHPSHRGMIGPGQLMNYAIPSADVARNYCKNRFKAGIGSWLDVALEELAEVSDAAYDSINPNVPECTEKQVREELVQLAAVCVAWIECIDRRMSGSEKDSAEAS